MLYIHSVHADIHSLCTYVLTYILYTHMHVILYIHACVYTCMPTLHTTHTCYTYTLDRLTVPRH